MPGLRIRWVSQTPPNEFIEGASQWTIVAHFQFSGMQLIGLRHFSLNMCLAFRVLIYVWREPVPCERGSCRHCSVPPIKTLMFVSNWPLTTSGPVVTFDKRLEPNDHWSMQIVNHASWNLYMSSWSVILLETHVNFVATGASWSHLERSWSLPKPRLVGHFGCIMASSRFNWKSDDQMCKKSCKAPSLAYLYSPGNLSEMMS